MTQARDRNKPEGYCMFQIAEHWVEPTKSGGGAMLKIWGRILSPAPWVGLPFTVGEWVGGRTAGGKVMPFRLPDWIVYGLKYGGSVGSLNGTGILTGRVVTLHFGKVKDGYAKVSVYALGKSRMKDDDLEAMEVEASLGAEDPLGEPLPEDFTDPGEDQE